MEDRFQGVLIGSEGPELLHGLRRTVDSARTTLARMVGDAAGYEYITFDDDVQLAAVTADPVRFAADLPHKTILDEVQRVPGLFLALKSAVDSDRRPGRLILTGSANVLLVPKLADSLAGRMEIKRLHPLSQDEIAGKASRFLDKLFAARFRGEYPGLIRMAGLQRHSRKESSRNHRPFRTQGDCNLVL